VHQAFGIASNPSLPDCEVCELIDRVDMSVTYLGFGMTFTDNMSDECSPPPEGCP